MSYTKMQTIRSALESAQPDVDIATAPDVDESHASDSHIDGLAEAIDTEEAVSQVALESMFNDFHRVSRVVASMEDHTPVSVGPALLSAVRASLEDSAKPEDDIIDGDYTEVPHGQESPDADVITNTAMVAQVTADMKDKASDSQDAAKGLWNTIKEKWERLMKFLGDIYKRMSMFIVKLFSSAQALKLRINRIRSRMAKLSMGEDKRGDLTGDAEKITALKRDLQYDGKFSPEPIKVLEAVHSVQKTVNAVEDGFAKKYAADHEKFITGIERGDAEQLVALLTSDIAMPAGMVERTHSQSQTRHWRTNALPGGWYYVMTQDVKIVDRTYKGTVYKFSEERKEPVAPEEIEGAPQYLNRQEIDQALKLTLQVLTETDHGKTIIARAAKSVERGRRAPRAVNGFTKALILNSLFHDRYRTVGRGVVAINARLLKIATRYLDWVDMTLDAYPAR